MIPATRAAEGVLAVELSGGPSVAMAGLLLADNGARVVKVEPPGGSPERRHPGHRIWNRGKESLIVGPDPSEEATILQRLLARADVLLHDHAPDAAHVLDWDDETLALRFPRLVRCCITAYGTRGPLAHAAAEDALVAARCGLMSNQPGWLPGPSFVAHPLPSIGAALLAVQGVCAALLWRGATGRGQRVETSLMAGTFAMSTHVVGEQIPRQRRWSWKPIGPSPFYSLYRCADGKWLQLGCIHPGFVKRAVEALGIGQAVRDPRFGDLFALPPGEAQEELFAVVARALKQRPRAAWLRLLELADVPAAAVRTAEEFLDDPQAWVNGIVELPDPEVGPVVQIGPAVRLSETPGWPTGPAPRTGQHAQALPTELGPGRQPRLEPMLDAQAREPRARLQPPLAGLRVLEMASLIAGPMAGRLLADLGAEVIKLESPGGGDIARRNGSPAFLPLNSGKRGIAVDLRHPEGQRLGHALARRADVLIDNMRPGAAERLGMGWEELRRINPRLVYCHITAFGSRGPYAHRPGLDPLAGALTGLQVAQGAYCGKPVYLQGAAVDHTAALLACSGILLALLARARLGVGQRVETSLLDAAALIHAHALTRYAGKRSRRDLRRSQYGLHALHRAYRVADGWLYLVAETEVHWRGLCRALGKHDLLEDARFTVATARARNDRALAGALAAELEQRGTEQWLAELQAAGVPCAPLLEGYEQQFWCDPQAVANGLVLDQQHPALGPIRLAHGWLRFSAAGRQCPSPAPLLGQHTRQVLRDLAYPEVAVDALREQGIIHAGEMS